MTLFRLAAAFVLWFVAFPATAQTIAQAAPSEQVVASVSSPEGILTLDLSLNPEGPDTSDEIETAPAGSTVAILPAPIESSLGAARQSTDVGRPSASAKIETLHNQLRASANLASARPTSSIPAADPAPRTRSSTACSKSPSHPRRTRSQAHKPPEPRSPWASSPSNPALAAGWPRRTGHPPDAST